ncbi:pectinesterase family protein [Bifidobacterium avesanii]|uniref:Pectinesterase n=1 Tax=Bifidobacterium avesanii TaxID=1798157 RepID=A0A7K3TJQ7_9BIFI|nr:pectinesterase family protein [Bifidobacterium avesanii]KAB8288909.1 Pectinesterase A precursor [Bifidobacterium avesanii]NEG79186.1 pectin methylesterase [Bifidobacterium avesanii]
MSGETTPAVLAVAKDGSAGFATIGAAIDHLMSLDDGLAPAEIRVAPGEYRERLVIRRPNLTITAAGGPRSARIVFGLGGRMPSPDGQGGKLGTFRTATVLVDAHDVTLRGLAIENDAGDGREVGQAIALYADGDRIVVDDCALLGRQDTLFTGPLPPKEIEPFGFLGPKRLAPRTVGRQLYRRCLIAGDVDFIFGSARAYFEECEIRSLDRGEEINGYATAASTPEGEPYGYVFDRCRFTTDPAAPAAPDSVYLGRPWRDWAQVALVDCELGAHIRVEGWNDWGKAAARCHSRFEALDPTGPGSAPMAWPRWTHTLPESERDRLSRGHVLGF